MKYNTVMVGALTSMLLFFGGASYASNESVEKQSGTLAGLFGSKPKFLPVNEAFGVSANQSGNQLTLQFKITPEHYLYQDRISLDLPNGVKAAPLSYGLSPTTIDDPQFGRVAVFKQSVTATTTLTNTTDKPISDTATIRWQGCANAGLCYPPETTTFSFSLEAGKSVSPEAKSATTTDKNSSNTTENNQNPPSAVQEQTSAVDANAATQSSDELSFGVDNESTDALDTDGDENVYLTTQKAAVYSLNHNPDSVASQSFGLDSNPVFAVILLFFAGVVLAFSACVYPMIPIVANIVARSHNPTAFRGFALTAAYGVGVATSYGLLGAAVALFGRSIGIIGWLQNQWVLTGFALVFVLLALQMFGVLRFGLPSSIKAKFAQSSQSADRYLGSVGGSFLVGVLSSLVVSPCVSAPLAGALVAVAVSGNVVLGFVALFTLGLGLSSPLIAMGAVGGGLLPKAGAWMESVKVGAGMMLILVAILLIDRVFWSPVMLVIWAGWFVAMGLFLWQLAKAPLRVVGVLCLMWSACLMIGAAMGHINTWQPLQNAQHSGEHKPDIHIKTLDELDNILAGTPKVLVDVTADWCVECRIIENTLFTNRPAELADWQVVKLDITDTTEHSRAILARYQLFGPPVLLYYRQGNLELMQNGEVSRQEFETVLAELK